MKRRILYTLLITGLIAMIAGTLLSEGAFAAQSDGGGGGGVIKILDELDVDFGGYSCPGSLHKNPSCPISGQMILGTFSGVVCVIESMIGNVFGSVFCAILKSMKQAVSNAVMIYIVLFGMSIAIGLVPLRTGRIVMHVIKAACVLVIATHAEYIIGFGYQFFMSLAQLGMTAALGINGNTGGFVLHNMDEAVQRIFGTFDQTRAFFTFAILAISMLTGGMGLAMLFLGDMFLILAVFLRAVLGYLLALMGIGLLACVAPLFMIFLLFTPTRPFFDHWIKYLFSFSLQIIFIFAYLAMIKFFTEDSAKIYDDAIKSLPDIINQIAAGAGTNKQPLSFTNFIFPWEWKHIEEAWSSPEIYGNLQQAWTYVQDKIIVPLIATFIIAYASESFLRNVPELAKQLSGQVFSARLGGITPASVAVSRKQLDLPGSEVFQAALGGATKGWNSGGNIFDKVRGGVGGGFTGFKRGLDATIADEMRHPSRVNPELAHYNNPEPHPMIDQRGWFGFLHSSTLVERGVKHSEPGLFPSEEHASDKPREKVDWRARSLEAQGHSINEIERVLDMEGYSDQEIAKVVQSIKNQRGKG